jgi:hypothetical protein
MSGQLPHAVGSFPLLSSSIVQDTDIDEGCSLLSS